MSTGDSGAPVLIAHRGVPARAPENSAMGFRRALAADAAVVELDVRSTQGECLIVLHDETPARVTGATTPAIDTSPAALIAQHFVSHTNEHLLLLDEALAILAGRTRIDIELKMDAKLAPDVMARRLLETLSRAGSPQDVIVSSECTDVLCVLAEHAPSLDRALVYRSADRRDPFVEMKRCRAGILVANKIRVTPELVERSRCARIPLWTYVVNDLATARELITLGCTGLITDDLPSLADALGAQAATSPSPTEYDRAESRRSPAKLLVIDLGSSSIKAALVCPVRGITDLCKARTPSIDGEKPGYRHDPLEIERAVNGVIEEIAAKTDELPVAAAIASQRSTGLWCDAATLDALTPAPSWRDARGESIVAELAASRRELEAIACLPLAPAWTAVQARVLASERTIPSDALLLPLASWLVARLTHRPPAVDPTLANRMFLLDGKTGRWAARLLDAFGLEEERLPLLRPSVAEWGSLAWPKATAQIPLLTVIGDQQAAYIGAAGPTGRRLVLNIGTATFAMRAGLPHETIPPGARRAPLWTSTKQPWSDRRLIEIPLRFDGERSMPTDARESTADDAARAVARAIAFGETYPQTHAKEISTALSSLAGPRDRSVLVCGGGSRSPHLRHLLAQTLSLVPIPHPVCEMTIVGAARLAAAAASLPWSVPHT